MSRRKLQRTTGPPAAFLAKMQRLLGEREFAQFVQSYDEKERVGLRVNTLKISATDFSRKSPFALSPLGAYEPAGFLVTDSRPGSHPYHAAGLYYLQEPAAMVVGSLVRPRPGELVLDLAAAPGGKATHLAALMNDDGLLVANDVNAGRARLLAENFERWGTRQTLITNDTPERLAATFGSIFDRVVVDAPCSGEGMFRRLGEFEWSQEMVLACARRQSSILETAADLVRPYGLLAYTTCTFSPEENEEVVARFLAQRRDFILVAPSHAEGFAGGRPHWVGDDLPPEQRQQLAHAIRLWPHRFAGEGHFIAIMRRWGGRDERQAQSFLIRPPQAQALQQWREFAQAHMQAPLPEERLHMAGDMLYLLPPGAIDTGSVRLVRYGLLLGEARKGYFRPAHTLAMALTPAEVQATVDYTADAPETAAYLAGHDLPGEGAAGWVLVTIDGHPLGWSKRVGNRLKNHYPRGLRRLA